MNRFAAALAGYAMAFLMTCGNTPALAEESSRNQVWTPLQFSLWPPLQIPDENCIVYGISMGAVMVGVHTFVEDEDYLGKGDDDVIGLQIGGLFAFSRKLYGFQVSGLGNDAGNIPCGFQVAGLFNYVEHDMGFGLQLAGLWNRYESGAGLQLAIANEVDKDFAGIQLGLCNWGESAPSKGRIAFVEPQTIVNFVHHVCHQQGVEDMRGLQVGLVNKAADMYGIQCGILWNNAKCARGLQVGLVNIADSLTGVQLGVANIIKDSPVLFLPLFNAHF